MASDSAGTIFVVLLPDSIAGDAVVVEDKFGRGGNCYEKVAFRNFAWRVGYRQYRIRGGLSARLPTLCTTLPTGAGLELGRLLRRRSGRLRVGKRLG